MAVELLLKCDFVITDDFAPEIAQSPTISIPRDVH